MKRRQDDICPECGTLLDPDRTCFACGWPSVSVIPVPEPPAIEMRAAPRPLLQRAPSQEDRLAEIAARYAPVDWEKAFADQPDEVQWLIEPVIEQGTVNALFAKVDTGKSLLALEWALRLVREGRTVVYVDEENQLDHVVERLTAFGADPGELALLRFYSFASLPALDTPRGGWHLLALADGADLVMLDTTSRMVQGKENDADTFLQMYRCSLVPLKRRGITVLRLDHPGKDEKRGQRGSSAKDGDCDTIWQLTEVTKGKRYRLERRKNRPGRAPGDAVIELERCFEPVRHEFSDAGTGDRVATLLDDLGIPPDAGRDRCGQALRDAGHGVRNEVLALAIRIRKARPAELGTGAGTAGQD
jgi:hypothetical protein